MRDKQEIVHYTFQIPEIWKNDIKDGAIIPVTVMKWGYRLFGWDVVFRADNQMLVLYLSDLSDTYGDVNEEEDYFMSFSLEDIDKGKYHSSEIDNIRVKLKCVWCVWDKTVDEFNQNRVKERKVIPPNLNLDTLKKYLGPYKEANTYEEKLMEMIDTEFIFKEKEDFSLGVFRVVEILDEYGIFFKSKQGQDILRRFVEHAKDEYYGDLRRSYYCDKCFNEFKLDYSLEQAYGILSYNALCQQCSGKIKSEIV